MHSLGFWKQVSSPDVREYAARGAGQGAERLISWYGQGHCEACRQRDRKPQQYRRPHYLRAGCFGGYEDRGQRDPDRHLMDKDTAPNEARGDRGRLRADTENEAVGKIVDRKPQDKRPERMLAGTFFRRIMRMNPAKRLDQEQQSEPPDETQYCYLPATLQTLGEELHERQREQDASRAGSRIRPSFRPYLPAKQGRKARP